MHCQHLTSKGEALLHPMQNPLLFYGSLEVNVGNGFSFAQSFVLERIVNVMARSSIEAANS